MLESSDYLVLEFENEIYASKPPLFNWVIALASAPRGRVDEWSARLPSVLSVVVLVGEHGRCVL